MSAQKRLAFMGTAIVAASLLLSLLTTPVLAESLLSGMAPGGAKSWSAHTTYHVRDIHASQTPPGLSPAQIRSAYNLPATGGSGTIAIVDAYDDPNIASDLATFDTQFNLAAASFTKYEMPNTPTDTTGWATEIALDVEWAHAIAPTASILLVEAASNSGTDLLAAVDYARSQPGVAAVSMSWGGSEFSSESSFDSYFTSLSGAVTFFASSGDSGAGVSWPASSPNVVGVGGTTLNMSGNTFNSERAWSGSGGGVSVYESVPSYQSGYGLKYGARAVPDVSYDADPYTGVSIYDTYGSNGWLAIGGTSVGAPQWAAIQALGNSASNSNFYKDAKSANYGSYFRDITQGSNGHRAAKGYDLATGLGSPLTTNYTPVVTPDFSLSATPSSQTVSPGSGTAYSVTVTPSNGFSGTVTFNVNGLPSGANGLFSPPSITGSGSSTLNVTTVASTPAGTYPLTVTGTCSSPNLVRTTSVTLVVNPTGSFSISASPGNSTISRGGSTTYSVTVSRAGGFNGNVSLTVSGLPNRSSGTFSPNPVAGWSSTLTIRTTSKTSTGNYKLTITGSSGGLKSSTSVTLITQ